MYHIHENGDIQRLDLYPSHEKFQASGQWTMQGIRHVKRNDFIPLASLFDGVPEELNGSSLRYKNGNPQWRVQDLDYGTTRVWGDGIADFRLIEA